jgi:hypothetical protein
MGQSWHDATAAVLAAEEDLCPDTPVIAAKFREGLGGDVGARRAQLVATAATAGGFSPEVLKATAHFVSGAIDDAGAGTFEGALRPALQFAGPPNYCPVLVGALAGAHFGASAIPASALGHCRPGVRERCAAAAAALSATSLEDADISVAHAAAEPAAALASEPPASTSTASEPPESQQPAASPLTAAAITDKGAKSCVHVKWRYVNLTPDADGIGDVVLIDLVCSECNRRLAQESQCISAGGMEIFDQEWAARHGMSAC